MFNSKINKKFISLLIAAVMVFSLLSAGLTAQADGPHGYVLSTEILNVKMQYEIGEEFGDNSGINVIQVYSDGYTELITENLTFDLRGFNTDKLGNTSVKVLYNGELLKYYFPKVGNPVIKSEVNMTNVKTNFALGEAFDGSNVTLDVTYADGTVQNIPSNELVINADNNYNNSKVGSSLIYVSAPSVPAYHVGDVLVYANSSYYVFVGNPVEKLQINADSSKLDYDIGDTFDPSNITVEAVYTDGTTSIISSDLISFSTDRINFNSEGIYNVYMSNFDGCGSFDVYVGNPFYTFTINSDNAKKDYVVGEYKNGEGITAIGTRRNGEQEQISNEDLTVVELGSPRYNKYLIRSTESKIMSVFYTKYLHKEVDIYARAYSEFNQYLSIGSYDINVEYTYFFGDVDTSNTPADISDLVSLKKHVLGTELLTETQQPYADLNDDTKIDVNDLSSLRKFVLVND